MDEINHDAATAAAAAIINLVNLSSPKAQLFGELVFIISAAISEAERMKKEQKRWLCLGCYRVLVVPSGVKKVKCPACRTRQRVGVN